MNIIPCFLEITRQVFNFLSRSYCDIRSSVVPNHKMEEISIVVHELFCNQPPTVFNFHGDCCSIYNYINPKASYVLPNYSKSSGKFRIVFTRREHNLTENLEWFLEIFSGQGEYPLNNQWQRVPLQGGECISLNTSYPDFQNEESIVTNLVLEFFRGKVPPYPRICDMEIQTTQDVLNEMMSSGKISQQTVYQPQLYLKDRAFQLISPDLVHHLLQLATTKLSAKTQTVELFFPVCDWTLSDLNPAVEKFYYENLQRIINLPQVSAISFPNCSDSLYEILQTIRLGPNITAIRSKGVYDEAIDQISFKKLKQQCPKLKHLSIQRRPSLDHIIRTIPLWEFKNLTTLVINPLPENSEIWDEAPNSFFTNLKKLKIDQGGKKESTFPVYRCENLQVLWCKNSKGPCLPLGVYYLYQNKFTQLKSITVTGQLEKPEQFETWRILSKVSTPEYLAIIQASYSEEKLNKRVSKVIESFPTVTQGLVLDYVTGDTDLIKYLGKLKVKNAFFGLDLKPYWRREFDYQCKKIGERTDITNFDNDVRDTDYKDGSASVTVSWGKRISVFNLLVTPQFTSRFAQCVMGELN